MLKILKDSNKISEDDLFTRSEFELMPGSQKARLVSVDNDESFFKNELIFIVKGSKVKFLPQKYNKVTMILSEEATSFFQRFERHGSDYNFEKIVKEDGTNSLKVDETLKQKILKDLSIGNDVDLIIRYNMYGRSTENGPIISLALINYRKSKVPEIDYFGL